MGRERESTPPQGQPNGTAARRLRRFVKDTKAKAAMGEGCIMEIGGLTFESRPGIGIGVARSVTAPTGYYPATGRENDGR